MPKFKTKIQLDYESSPLENMLEKSLNAHHLKLGPLMYEEGGLYRSFIFEQTKDKILYEKGEEHESFAYRHEEKAFPNIPKIIELFERKPYRVDESITFRRELEDDFGEIKMERIIFSDYKHQRFWITPQGESGEELFTNALNIYLNSKISLKEIRKCIFDRSIEKSSINSILERKQPIVKGRMRKKLRDRDYVRMMVNYFCCSIQK